MNEKMPSNEKLKTTAFNSGLLVIGSFTFLGLILDMLGGGAKFGIITFFFFVGGILAAIILGLVDLVRGCRKQSN